MADFKDHITALTGLTISGSGTTPLESQLSEFLKDGIKDVVNRIIKLRPDELPKFCKTTNSTGSSDASVTITGEVSSVAREHDSTTILRKCTKISPDLRYLATDADSIYYRSKYNPAYYELDGLIYSVPQASSTSNNDLVVTQVHYDIGIAHSDTYNNTGSNIDNFPTEYEYLVGLYAAIKSLQNALSAVNISTFSLSGSTTAPSNPSVTTVSYTDATNADASATGLSTVTVATVAKADISGDVPTYTSPVFTSSSTHLTEMEAGVIGHADSDIDVEHWFSIAGQLIEDEEDTELAQSHLQKISTFIQAFQADMQNQLNKFNKENARYQANVQAEIAKHNTDLQKAINDAQLAARETQQEAQQTTDIDKFNKQQDQVLMLQNKAKTMEAIIANNNSIIQDFQAEMQAYSGKVAAQVQTYQQEIAEKSAEYQWQAGRLQDLKQEYNQAFAMMAPPQPQQAAGGR